MIFRWTLIIKLLSRFISCLLTSYINGCSTYNAIRKKIGNLTRDFLWRSRPVVGVRYPNRPQFSPHIFPYASLFKSIFESSLQNFVLILRNVLNQYVQILSTKTYNGCILSKLWKTKSAAVFSTHFRLFKTQHLNPAGKMIIYS